MNKLFTTALLFLAAAAGAMATPQGGNTCASDGDCAYGFSCCKAIPAPKCVKLPSGTVC